MSEVKEMKLKFLPETAHTAHEDSSVTIRYGSFGILESL